MSGLENAAGDIGLLRKSYKKRVAAGEMVIGAEFEMTFIGEDELLSVLVRTAQIPEMKRQEIEDFGPMGLGFTQKGAYINKGQISVTCVENLSGATMAFVRDCVVNKKYVDITISMKPESLGDSPADSMVFNLYDCSIGSEAIDLSTEDNTALVKPTLLIDYNWAEPETGR